MDPSGAKLLVTYNDGSTTTVDVTYDMLNYDGSKLGDQYVTVTYQGKTAAFLINIQPYSTGKHIITVLAGAGGSVTPSGSVYVADQDSLSVAIQAGPGYRILSVAVDGQDMGAIGSYTFEKVSGDHTLVASFAKDWRRQPRDHAQQARKTCLHRCARGLRLQACHRVGGGEGHHGRQDRYDL